jgi:hypothetical protein
MCQDSVTGLLLAGIGHVDNQQKKNFLIVDSSTPDSHTWRAILTLCRDTDERHRVGIPGLYRTKRYRYPPDQPACQSSILVYESQADAADCREDPTSSR